MKSINDFRKTEFICAGAAVINLALFFVKLYIAISSNSISIYIDSLNSIADTFICALAAAGFRISSMKPSEKYPFGLGRTEDVVNFLLSAVILGTGFAFIYTSLQRLMYPVPVWFSVKYAVAIAIGAFVKLFLAVAFRKAGKSFGSEILRNIGIDSTLDFMMSVCIVISFTLTVKLGYAVDSVTGIIASVIIIISGFGSIKSTLGSLIGRRDDKICGEAKNLLKETDGVADVVSVECHSYAHRKVFNAEITVSDSSDVCQTVTNCENIIQSELNALLYIKIKR